MLNELLHLDQELFLALNFDGGAFADRLFWLASGKLTWVPLYLLIVWLLWRRYGWKQTLVAVAFMALCVVCVDQIANFFKTFTPKFRPTHTEAIADLVHTVNGYRGGLYGTVSAHAATLFSIAVFSLALVRSRDYTVCILLWALFAPYSRTYLGVHFPMDILLGMTAGIVTAAVALKLYRKTINYLER